MDSKYRQEAGASATYGHAAWGTARGVRKLAMLKRTKSADDNIRIAPRAVELLPGFQSPHEQARARDQFREGVMDVFTKLDADGDGFLVKSELQKGMKGSKAAKMAAYYLRDIDTNQVTATLYTNCSNNVHVRRSDSCVAWERMGTSSQRSGVIGLRAYEAKVVGTGSPSSTSSMPSSASCSGTRARALVLGYTVRS